MTLNNLGARCQFDGGTRDIKQPRRAANSTEGPETLHNLEVRRQFDGGTRDIKQPRSSAPIRRRDQ